MQREPIAQKWWTMIGTVAVAAALGVVAITFSRLPAAAQDPASADDTPPSQNGPTVDVPDDRPAFAFRGVVPGQTSRADLLGNERWGDPFETSKSDEGEVLRYRIRGYPDARVLVRGGIVQTIDVAVADGVREEVAVNAFGLGTPEVMPLPAAAKIDALKPSDKWTPRPYSAGRVVLYVEKVGDNTLARLMRVHAAVAADAGGLIALDPGDTEIRVKGQDDRSRQIVKYVVTMLDQNDYAGRKLDDKMAAGWLEEYLQTLDGGKNFLLEEDVERFRRMAPTIDDRAKQGDIGFAYDAFETYVKRRASVLKLVTEFLAAEHDFTVDEELAVVGPDAPWPENEIEAREIWRKRVKYQILTRRVAGASDKEAIERVTRFYANAFQLPKQMDDNTLIEWTLSALGAARGGTARFYSPRALEENQTQISNQFVGIGAQLKLEDGEVVVTGIVPGSPAHADGRLSEGDVIVSVGQGDSGGSVPLLGLRLQDSVDHIRGPKGSTVRLTVRPQRKGESIVIRLQRDSFPLVAMRSTTFDAPGGDGKIGWIAANSFYVDPAAGTSSVLDMTKMLADFRSQGVGAVVLDLRTCTGGPLQQSIDVFGLFADGPVVQAKDNAGNVSTFRANADVEIAWHGPLVVLVSTRTGGGAMIVAAAVKDHARGLVIGDTRTSTDAQVQTIQAVGPELFKIDNPPNLGAVRYTTLIFHDLNGSSPHGKGGRPDIVLPSFTEYAGIETDAKQIVPKPVPAATYTPLGLVSAATIDALAQKSEQRRKSSPQFAELERQVEEYRRRQQRKSVPLNEAVARTEQAVEFDYELPDMTREDVVRHGPYVDEVLAITQDYVTSMEWLSPYTRAWRTLREGKADASAKLFDEVISAAASAKAPYLGRAHARAAAGEWEKAIEDLKKAGSIGIRVTAAQDGELRVQDKLVAAVKRGDRLVIDNQQGEWLWARLPADRSKAGWVKPSFVRFELGGP